MDKFTAESKSRACATTVPEETPLSPRDRFRYGRRGGIAGLMALLGWGALSGIPTHGVPPPQPPTPETDLRLSVNDSGLSATVFTQGTINARNPFFQSLGTNGRSCVTCHQPTIGFSITPRQIQQVFESSRGLDPLFRLNDGSNTPQPPTGQLNTLKGRRDAFSMLLNRGVIRVGLPIPANAEFTLQAAHDPYGFASANELSLFRRPLPSTNLNFLTTIMWDGRESPAGRSHHDNLKSQVLDATLGHAQAGTPPTSDQMEQIVTFESGLFTAQIFDNAVGGLFLNGGNGGPFALSRQNFYPGINDTLGADPTGAAFDPKSMNLYKLWEELKGNKRLTAPFEAIARGEKLFNTKEIPITGVKGLNDALGVEVIKGTCTTCHNTPNVGNHSLPLPINIGIADVSRPGLDTTGLPVYTLRNNATGETQQTTDPGRALVTGKWADIGKFKGPILRGLASRPPYFHNGSAANLNDVVDFYNSRFNIGFTAQEKSDLVKFLNAL